MNVQPGQKARVVLFGDALSIGMENNGIVVLVDRLAAPGEHVNARVKNGGPAWHVTSISRPFQLFSAMETHDGRYRVIKPLGTTWEVVIPDQFLKPILDEDEKQDQVVDAIVHS